jgi:hypothetical protein
MSNLNEINIYNDPIIARKRKGTPEDPHLRKNETLTVINGKALLTETPERKSKVFVKDGENYLYEITDGALNESTYKVDYTEGIVYLNNVWSNKSLTFTYYGEGAHFFPDSRIWVENDTNGSVMTAKDKFKDIDRENVEQKARVDNLINSTPQADEVLDIRVDDNGNTFATAKERVDSEQKKIEQAYQGNDGRSYTSIKHRFDEVDARAEDNEILVGEVDKFQAEGYSLTDKVMNEFSHRGTNVMWYGAKGDGINDDTAAIQEALDLGGSITIPKGTYNISQSLVVGSNTFIQMDAETVIKATADIYCIFKNGKSTDTFSGYSGNGNIKISGGTLDCNSAEIAVPIGGIVFGHGENISFENITIKDVREIHHIEINSLKNVLVENCNFVGFAGVRTFSEAIQIDLAASEENFPVFGSWDNTLCQYITIRDCSFTSVGSGIGTHVQESQLWHDHILIENCEFINLLSHGISVLNFKKFKIRDNVFVNTDNGIYIDGSYDGSIYTNDFKDTIRNGIMISNSSSIHIEQPTASRSGENGISVYNGCKNIHITNANITESLSNGINFSESTESSVSNSTIIENGAHGLFIHDSSSFIKVSDNFIKNNAFSGVNLSVNSFECEINHNYLDGNCTLNSDGIYSNINVYTGAYQNHIKNNTIKKGTGSAKYGIAIGSDAGDKNAINNNNTSNGGVQGEFSNAQSTTIIEGLEWKPLTLFNGWTTYSAGTEVKYAVKGDQIVFRGIIKPGVLSGTDNDSSMVFKIPIEDAPKTSIFKITGGLSGGATDFARCNFFLSGRMTIPTIGNLSAVDLTGLTILYYSNSR